MTSNMRAVTHAAAVLAANSELKTVGQLMRAARCSSWTAQRAIAHDAAQDKAAALLRQQPANGPRREEHVEAAAEGAEIDEHAPIAAADALGVMAKKREWRLRAKAKAAAGGAASRPIDGVPDEGGEGHAVHDPARAKRARALVREQLKHGPRPGAQIEAAALAADIPQPVLLVVTDELGVRTKRGEWRLPERGHSSPR
jgi:hypothetical protein